jgi:predicted ATPase
LIDTGGDARAWPPRVDVSLVGRRQELTLLRAELHRAIAEGRARLVTVVGEPGIGKSRLARELRHAVRDEARVLVGRCPAYGEALTYWPLREIVGEALEEGGRSLLSILGDEAAAPALADRVESLLTEASAYPVEELRWAAQRFLSLLASHVPVVVMIDDVHWAEPTFLDLVDFAVRESDAPLLVLCLARPEFLEEHPDWAGTTVALESLSEEESFELLGLLAPAFVEDERIVAAASGNPLFLEQLAAFAAEQRGVEPAGAIPPSLRSLLAARLDRLGPGERAALECAAVVGHDFPAGAVAELLPPEGRATVERHLRALTDRGLVEDHRVQGLPEHGYRFRHVLIQEAAYRSLPKSRRAELHERLATWLERELTRPTEDEIIGYHLEKAHGYTRELGGDPGETRALAARAGARLATAGEAALARNDLPAGTKLLAVATELLEVAGEPRLDLLADLGTALFPLGELREALAVLERAVEAADAAGEPGVEWRARLELDYVSSQMKADTASNAEQLERAEEAIRILTQVGDERGLARAWRAKAQLDFWLGDSEKAMEDADRAIEFARQVGDRQEETWMVRQYCMALWCGPTPAAEAARECERILAGAWNQTVAACALENLGGLRAMQGDLGEGRSLNERARAIYADLGLTYRVAVNLGFYTFFHHRLAGDPAAAERDVRRSIELFKSVGDEGARSTATAYLGHALYDLGRYDEAEQQILESEQLSGPDDWATQTNLWTARGRILARRGDLESARAAADRAIRIAEATDDLDTRGSVWADKAEVCEIAGDWKDAALCLEHAIALLDRKGDAVLAGRARARLASLAAGSPVDSAG